MNSYLTGTPTPLAINPITAIQAAHVIICILVMVFSFTFINCYLERNHSMDVIMAEKTAPSKNMFSLRMWIVAGVMFLTASMVIIYLQKTQQTFPMGAVIVSLSVVLTNFYFASKIYVVEYFLVNLRRYQNSYQSLIPVIGVPVNIFEYFPRSNHVGITGLQHANGN